MSYRERQRLEDIRAAIDAIRSHLQRGDLSDGLVSDAVRIRLLEIGEAVKALPASLLSSQPNIPWNQIARMRDHLAHRYFDTDHAVLQATIDNDLPELESAIEALLATLPDEDLPEQPADRITGLTLTVLRDLRSPRSSACESVERLRIRRVLSQQSKTRSEICSTLNRGRFATCLCRS